MIEELKNRLQTCYEMCDVIERAREAKEIRTSLRENLKQELLNVMIYLSYADGDYGEREKNFIYDILNEKISAQTALNIKTQRHLYPNFFGMNVPYVVKNFVLSDAAKKVPNDKFKHKKAKYLVETIALMGQLYIAEGEVSSAKEIEVLSKYTLMLDKFLQKYGLLRPDQKTKILTSKEIEESQNDQEVTAEDILAELNGLVGLTGVKEEVNQLVNLLKVQKLRSDMGLKTTAVNKHLVFSGNPGTGKTTVARLLSKVYKAIGVAKKGHLVEVDRSGLVSGYIGQTAMKVNDVVEEALGGILFIDEAYALTHKKGDNDFGQEAVDTLLKNMEDHRDDLIVICAGYTELMEEFMDSNPGLRSRFSKVIEFEDYTPEEEIEILKSMCKAQDYSMTEDAIECAIEFFTERAANKTKTFANARDVRNYLEKAITRQASRIVNSGIADENDTKDKEKSEDINKKLLLTIEEDDVIGITLE